jgi:hypothetical protein
MRMVEKWELCGSTSQHILLIKERESAANLAVSAKGSDKRRRAFGFSRIFSLGGLSLC